MNLASRMRLITPSGIRKVFELAATLRDPIDLSIGQPDFETPEPVQQAAVQAIRKGFNRYTVTQGVGELNDRLLRRARERGQRVEASLVTSGVSGGLLLAYLALLDPGDEVLIPDPYFVSYRQLARIIGAVPVPYSLYPDFRLRVSEVERRITPRTRLLVLNSPANPTGAVFRDEELRELAGLLAERRLPVVSDEIYELFTYEHEAPSIASHLDGVLVLGGFSKSWAIPGWRVGWALGPSDVIDAMRTIQQFTFVCAPSFGQKGALAALDTDMSARRDEYRRKRDLVWEGLREHYDAVRPDGAFYLFARAPGGSGTKFFHRCLEENLLVVPGSAFSDVDTHFRISFAVPDEKLAAGIAALQRLARG